MEYTNPKRDILMKVTKLLRKSSLVALSLLLGAALFATVLPAYVSAELPPEAKSTLCKEGSGTQADPCVNPDVEKIKQDAENSSGAKVNCPNKSDCGSIITNLVNPLIKLLTASIGVVIVISLVMAGIGYSSAGGDPSKVAAAKNRINNTIIALILYIFMLGLIQWLVPGGLV
jgi:hypothetical protein